MELVLAEAALKGARVTARVRIAMIVLLILSQRSAVFLSGEPLPLDPGRTVAATLYLLYASWISTPSSGSARISPACCLARWWTR